ncbi:MAG: hypothetical protein JO327_12555 [Nitrososphaeraceae archaeon]|nr:hypothetical protein [Nitrososphaeraceae archaeon]
MKNSKIRPLNRPSDQEGVSCKRLDKLIIVSKFAKPALVTIYMEDSS